MIDVLKKNVDKELEILREISIFTKKMERAGTNERVLLSESVSALKNRMKELNNLIPGILNKIQLLEEREKTEVRGEEIRMDKGKNLPQGELLRPIVGKERFLSELEITDRI